MANAAASAPLRQPPECPRCRASGHHARIQSAGAALACFTCGTTWERGELGQLIAVRQEATA